MSKKLKLYKILPNLYQSGKTHDLLANEKQALLHEYGIHLIVNLWHTIDFEMYQMVRYWHQPFTDGKGTDIAKMERLADELVPWILKDKLTVLTHCYGGRNRSGLLNAMILMRVLPCSGEVAYNYIRERRPNSLVNTTFANWLKEAPCPVSNH